MSQCTSTNLNHLVRIKKPTAGLFNFMTSTQVIGTQEARQSPYLADCAVFVQLNYKSTGIICVCEGTSISSWTVSRSNSLILLRYSLFFIHPETNVTFEGGSLQCSFRLVEDETAWWWGEEFRLDSAQGGGPAKAFAGSSDKLIASINWATSERGTVLIFRSQDSGRSRKSPFIMAVLLKTSKDERRRNRE